MWQSHEVGRKPHILAPQKCDRDKASDERDILLERVIYLENFDLELNHVRIVDFWVLKASLPHPQCYLYCTKVEL